MEWIWLGALIFFTVIEAATSTLVSLWFIGGALAALFTTLCGGVLWLQILVFFAVSALLLLLLRPLVKKYIDPHKQVTNVQTNVGKQTLVIERIDNLRGTGAVKLSGVEWSARSADGAIIEPDTTVRVTAIEGAKVLVERVD